MKSGLADHTFQKPHHSRNDLFWWKKSLFPQKKSGAETPSNSNGEAVVEPTPTALNDQAENIFIIKSQTKLSAKRVARLNKIRAFDPFYFRSDKSHKGSFFQSEKINGGHVNDSERELPNESQWVFNPKNLQKIADLDFQGKQISLQSCSKKPFLNDSQPKIVNFKIQRRMKNFETASSQSILSYRKDESLRINTENCPPLSLVNIPKKPESARLGSANHNPSPIRLNSMRCCPPERHKIRFQVESNDNVVKALSGNDSTPAVLMEMNVLEQRDVRIRDKHATKIMLPLGRIKSLSTYALLDKNSVSNCNLSGKSEIQSSIDLNQKRQEEEIRNWIFSSPHNSATTTARKKVIPFCKGQVRVLQKIFNSNLIE